MDTVPLSFNTYSFNYGVIMIFKSIGIKDIETAIEKLFTILCIWLSFPKTKEPDVEGFPDKFIPEDKFDELHRLLLDWIIKHYQSKPNPIREP